jgi:hypothetical protein
MEGQSDELCLQAYKALHEFLKRLGERPLEIVRGEAGGHSLACYCKPSRACHADILLEFPSPA